MGREWEGTMGARSFRWRLAGLIAAASASGFIVASHSLTAADNSGLLTTAQQVFQPLPKDIATPEFPITPERVELGRALFFDPRLTIDANMSCSSCHQPAFYG